MTKKKLNLLGLFLLLPILFAIGCGIFETNQSTKSGSGSSSGSTVTSQEAPPHGQATVNLLERAPFKGKELDPVFWSNMEAYCKAGPTQLIIADMNLVLVQMSRAGFVGRAAAQCYALATTYAGMSWSPQTGDEEVENLWADRERISAWWSSYVRAVVQVMQKAPQTTAIIIINDGPDLLGFRLGPATYSNMGSVANRVQVGDMMQYLIRK